MFPKYLIPTLFTTLVIISNQVHAQQSNPIASDGDQATPQQTSYEADSTAPPEQYDAESAIEGDDAVFDESVVDQNNAEIADQISPAGMDNSPLLSDDSVTIYVDAKWGSRTTKAAVTLTESHSQFAKQGYRLQDVDLYTEDGDLKGFFVTYTRIM